MVGTTAGVGVGSIEGRGVWTGTGVGDGTGSGVGTESGDGDAAAAVWIGSGLGVSGTVETAAVGVTTVSSVGATAAVTATVGLGTAEGAAEGVASSAGWLQDDSPSTRAADMSIRYLFMDMPLLWADNPLSTLSSSLALLYLLRAKYTTTKL